MKHGEKMTCERCGKEIIRRNWQQRYCEDCADKIHSSKIPRPKRAKK